MSDYIFNAIHFIYAVNTSCYGNSTWQQFIISTIYVQLEVVCTYMYLG